MRNFNTEIGGYNFEFKTVSIRTWSLFHVYVTIQGAKRRFHMTGDEKGFRITDPFEQIEGMEQGLSDSILAEMAKDEQH